MATADERNIAVFFVFFFFENLVVLATLECAPLY